ncbi:DNA alkylation repair protein [Pseudoalteromonas luteoviolacea]|uniref:DNA alkylation repair protein n=1 Tax=Pseudoalteromonas luteoviolacea TaxID=43657 RepID=UPI001F287196|nr:DNA alkylation repair protein [Pseudoalteromonas luteoviolacea]MCF6438625.1 DNA alkylation repair protein [Pseudoalteromonas luteoviolacea]
MPEPFKNVFDLDLVHTMARHFQRIYPDFSYDAFIKEISLDFNSLEFKQRSNRICDVMEMYLPQDFEQAARIIELSLGDQIEGQWSSAVSDKNGISGWAILPMADYVAKRGRADFKRSMHLLKALTKRNTAEFAIRYFLEAEPERTLEVMKTWAQDDNIDVRRLASEGCRPRLPWGLRLKKFVHDPEPVIELLSLLKDDPSEYVRRSVANNLNDIAKDHPDRVCEVAIEWLQNASPERTALIKHGCRTLVKNGHVGTLEALGYRVAQLSNVKLSTSAPKLKFGSYIELMANIESGDNKTQSLMIDYIVHHQKANGSTSPKVFKWKTLELAPNSQTSLKKRHTIKPITTRVYYPGVHKVELQINGNVVADTQFELEM